MQLSSYGCIIAISWLGAKMIVGSELWPMPTYGDLLFNV